MDKFRIPIFERKKRYHSSLGRNKVRIPMFGRIRAQLQCLENKVTVPILIEKKVIIIMTFFIVVFGGQN